MATASFKVSNVKLNSQSQTSGSLSGENVNNAIVGQIVGYAPTEFATIAASATVQLKTAPGLAQGAATQPTDLRLPVGAIPFKVVVNNNGTIVADDGTNNDTFSLSVTTRGVRVVWRYS